MLLVSREACPRAGLATICDPIPIRRAGPSYFHVTEARWNPEIILEKWSICEDNCNYVEIASLPFAARLTSLLRRSLAALSPQGVIEVPEDRWISGFEPE
jgi:hypothetical protein